MALNSARPAARLCIQTLRHCKSQTATPSFRPLLSSSPFSSSNSSSNLSSISQLEAAVEEVPRYARTPPRMKAPFSPHITKNPANSIWKVNEDPQKLDDALNNFYGKGGERLLPDELKWLAVTHKSFDQGRRGFNDRLAFLGRQIVVLECTQNIITNPDSFQKIEKDPFEGRREPFETPALTLVDNLSADHPMDILTLESLQKLAVDTGLAEVIRWKPRKTDHLKQSGMKVVMAGTIYALIGAVSLQHGGKAASRIVRERVFKKLHR